MLRVQREIFKAQNHSKDQIDRILRIRMDLRTPDSKDAPTQAILRISWIGRVLEKITKVRRVSKTNQSLK
jgi:hypothetical protein